MADRWWLGAAQGTLGRLRSGMNGPLRSAFVAEDLVGAHLSRIETGS